MESGCSRVSSRDLGRYLKRLIVPGVGSVLHEIKTCHGGLYSFLTVSAHLYTLQNDPYKEDASDHSYWISPCPNNNNDNNENDDVAAIFQEYAAQGISQAEKVFWDEFYSLAPLGQNRQVAYQRTLLLSSSSQDNNQYI